MKTILKIFAILIVTLLVAGGIFILVENTSITENLRGGERPEFAAGERSEMPEGDFSKRGEGGSERGGRDHDRHAASFSEGMAGVGKSLAKIGVISLVVLLVQAAFGFIKKQRRLKPNLG